MKKILFVFLMLLPAAVAMPQNQTPRPEIWVVEGDGAWVVGADGEGEVFLFLDEEPVENPYTIWLTNEEQQYLFKAYAQAEGCLPSDWVYCEVDVSVQDPVLPVDPEYGVIIYQTDESVILEPFVDPEDYNDGYYTLRLYIYGEEVDYPYVLERQQEDYEVFVTVQLEIEGVGADLIFECFVEVPALETISPYDVNGDGEVNIADMNAIISSILNNSFNEACDVNGDGEVNIADVNEVISRIVGGDRKQEDTGKRFIQRYCKPIARTATP